LCAIVGAPRAAAQGAQAARAVVLDSATLAPIAGAALSLKFGDTGEPASIWRATSDSSGAIRIPLDLGRRLDISVQRIGYSPRRLVIDVDAVDTLRILLAPLPVSVAAVRVVERAPSSRALELSGFFDRRQAGIGKFLDSARIARQQPTSLTSLLRPYLKGCTMIFVDGFAQRELREVDPERVTGIEIYASNSEAPTMFRNPIESTKRCGSIVVWTTR
jgi:hypothetical protein